jgi:hypothetical protein
MTVFRWLIGAIAALTAAGSLGSFMLFMTSRGEHWIVRARRLRRWAWLAMLLWFNVEVWGRVILTLVNWGR